MDRSASASFSERAVALGVEFGAKPSPYLELFGPPASPSPVLPEHDTEYLNHPNKLRYTESEQAIINKLGLARTLYTEWPAFHWDMDALEADRKESARSGSRDLFDFGDHNLDLESKVYELDSGEGEVEAFVGPTNSTFLPGSGSNYIVAGSGHSPAPGSPVADDSKQPFVNANPAQAISSVASGEDIPRDGTPDFQILRSLSSSAYNPLASTPIPENIPLSLSCLGSEDSNSNLALNDVEFGWDLDREWNFSLFLHSAFRRSLFYSGFMSFEEDPAELELESAVPIEIGGTEGEHLVGSSLAALLDLDSLDAELDSQYRTVASPGELEDGEPMIIYATSGLSNAAPSYITSSSSSSSELDTGFSNSVVNITSLAGEESRLLFSHPPFPPLPELHPIPSLLPSPSSTLEIAPRLQVMDNEPRNEAEAQSRCRCEKCKPFVMKSRWIGGWAD